MLECGLYDGILRQPLYEKATEIDSSFPSLITSTEKQS